MKYDKKESLGRIIYLTAREIKNFAEKILFPYDLTLEQFHLLKNMSHTHGMTQRNLRNSQQNTCQYHQDIRPTRIKVTYYTKKQP